MLNKNLPATTSNTAKIIKPKKINFLKCFDIFFDEVFATNLSIK
jgi:hypothetical protein